MSTTLLRQDGHQAGLDAPLAALLIRLNIAAVASAGLMLLLACWGRLRRCHTHSDKQRCRIVAILSASYIYYSASQLAVLLQPARTGNHIIVRMAAFVATFSIVFNSLLIAGAVGLDSAVRYGLRSFGLARRLSGCCEVACLVGALTVSQPVLYLFATYTWTGSAVSISATPSAFEAVVWMTESAWVLLALAMAAVLSTFAIVKANKIARYTANCHNASAASVFGGADNVQSRAAISSCYTLVLILLYSWKLAFRVNGSTSEWLLCAAGICESLLPMPMLLVFIADLAINIKPADDVAWLSASTICELNAKAADSKASRLNCKSFTSWRKSRFLEWQKCVGNSNHLPTNDDIKQWIGEVQQCHIRSDTSHYKHSDMRISCVSATGLIGYSPDALVLHPLTV